ncbi:MAG: phosphatase domain-containing protein [Gammaproteobacteria bacterium]
MKIAISSLIAGILLCYLGLTVGGLAFFAVWLGISFLITAWGYAFGAAGIYGKQADGQLAFWSVLLHLPYFLFLLSVWHAIRRLNRENAFDRITDDIMIGRRLLVGELPDDIATVVDLTAEFHEPSGLIANINYIALPILDSSVPDLNALNEIIAGLPDGKTYIHCAQGHGRTGLFTAFLLIKRGIVKGPDAALVLLKKKRPALSLTAEQNRYLRKAVADNPE